MAQRSSAVVACLAAALTLSGWTARVRAQEPAPPPADPEAESDLAEARALFVAGAEAARAGRWSDAVVRFARAYELSRVPAALYNLAFALRALGRHVEARDAFEELLAEHSAALDPAMLAESQRLVVEERTRIATLYIDGLAPSRRHELRLDGARIPDEGTRPVRLEADPGQHTVMVGAEGFQPFVWEGALTDGEQRHLRASLKPEKVTTRIERVEVEDDSLFESPVFWSIVGVALIAAGVGVGIHLQNEAQLDPMSGRRYRL
jgi:hypothetical protein